MLNVWRRVCAGGLKKVQRPGIGNISTKFSRSLDPAWCSVFHRKHSCLIFPFDFVHIRKCCFCGLKAAHRTGLCQVGSLPAFGKHQSPQKFLQDAYIGTESLSLYKFLILRALLIGISVCFLTTNTTKQNQTSVGSPPCQAANLKHTQVDKTRTQKRQTGESSTIRVSVCRYYCMITSHITYCYNIQLRSKIDKI